MYICRAEQLTVTSMHEVRTDFVPSQILIKAVLP